MGHSELSDTGHEDTGQGDNSSQLPDNARLR